MDREKVINALECCYCNFPKQMDCKNCPYDKICYHDKACSLMLRDALELLKEKDAVEPTLIREGRNKHYNDYVCPRCDNEVVYEQNYCSECGVPFSWEGRGKEVKAWRN